MDFTDEQIQRYSRHIILSDVGVEGQEKISRAKILVIGAGGLGSPILLYLAAAGIGTIGIADKDVVDLSNLQRQVIHFTPDIDNAKILSAKAKINRLNPDVIVKTYRELVDADNILDMIDDYDFIIDATDNFPSKFLINDACVLASKPFSHAGVLQFIGQTMTVIPGKSACYRCIFHKPPPPDSVPDCSQVGLLGAIPGVLGMIQAVETLKFVIQKGNLLINQLMLFDALDMEFNKVKITRRKDCPICGSPRRITSLIDYEQTIRNLKQ